ncbi:MAG: class I SAM-dependent rRNA methyltransferase [Fuerstiella sp.]|nr:class I SAM-dependent rRNA methyltransferase [Fuerstiella sp.]
MSDVVHAEGPVAIIRKRRAQPFFGRHPWVFAGAIERIESADGIQPGPGDPIQVRSHQGEFIGWGLLNPTSNIRIRMYSWTQQETITENLLCHRIRAAISCRSSVCRLDADGTACRLIFSEGDLLSGLTVDWYNGFVLVQFTSLALYHFREAILEQLKRTLQPQGIWLRTERGMREAEGLEITDRLVSGQEPPRPLFIVEGELQFGVDVQQGQKTGFYLDQRQTRKALTRYTRGHRVLDVYCYSGAFGLTAVRSGEAKQSLGIDSSAAALNLATANAQLNGVADRCEFRNGDARVVLSELAQQGTEFDTVILDPPRMARTRAGIERAIRAYIKLNLQGVNVLKPDGILVTCNCSGLVSRNQFFSIVAETSRQSRRHIQILETHGQPNDHPVSAVCPETEYLKVCLCRVS